MDDALRRALEKRLILTVTTGRSGTEYLARVLGAFRDVHAEHEPKPTFGSAWRTVMQAPPTAREFWLAHKLPRVARTRAPLYAETSHLVCKGFLESAIDLGLRMTWLHLRRPAREVAVSLWRLGTIPGRSYAGVKYYLSPWDPRVRRPLIGARPEQLDDYQLCYWYCLEIAARAEEYARLAPQSGVRFVAIDLASLLTTEGVERLGELAELGPLSTLGRVQLSAFAGRRFNDKSGRKRPLTFAPARLDELEHELRELCGLRASP